MSPYLEVEIFYARWLDSCLDGRNRNKTKGGWKCAGEAHICCKWMHIQKTTNKESESFTKMCSMPNK